MRAKNSKSQGGVAVELAVALPVALAFLMFMYWFFLSVTWKNALRDAVVNAVDLAQSRGNSVSMGKATESERNDTSTNPGVLNYLEDLKTGNWVAEYLGEIGQNGGLLVGGLAPSGGGAESTGTGLEVYNAYMPTLGWPQGTVLQNFNVENYYAMAYAYELIRARISNSVSFPCDPADTNNSISGAGCLICTPPTFGLISDPAGEFFGVQCSLRPSDVLLNPIMRLLNGIGASPIIMTAAAIDRIS